jgi:DNA transposition AAA+ family ATPase
MSNSTPEKETELPLYKRVAWAQAQEGFSLRKLLEAMQLDGVISPRTLQDWLKGQTIQKSAEVESAVTAWLSARERAHERKRPDTSLVALRVTERIQSALAYAMAYGEMVSVTGAPGMGKTRAFSDFAKQYPHVYFCTMLPEARALVPCLQLLARGCGVTDQQGGALHISEAIARHLRGQGALLIVDESQHLSLPALDAIRSLHDRTGLAVCLGGNEYAEARMRATSTAVHYAQIRSRIGLRVMLQQVDESDVESLARAHGVDDETSIRKLRFAAAQHGSLRNVAKVLVQARAGGKPPTQARVFAALRNMGLFVRDEEEGVR